MLYKIFVTFLLFVFYVSQAWGVILIREEDSVVWTHFIEDFEDTITWDADSGNLVTDCDGYDTIADFCDQDTNSSAPEGSQSMGIYGQSDAYYVEVQFSEITDEIIIEGWIQYQNLTLSEYWFYVLDNSLRNFRIGHGAPSAPGVYFDDGTSAVSTLSNLDVTSPSVDTWYHLYIRIDPATNATSNDGTVEIGMSTSSTHSSTDTISSVDTQRFHTTDGIDAFRFVGNSNGGVTHFDYVGMR